MTSWFTLDCLSADTFVLSEYRHWEETHCYLLCGTERALLIDTGLGISNIYDEVRKLTSLPITAVATHVHWDHIGGHKYFPDFYAHAAELDWLCGQFPLPLDAVKGMVLERCELPEDFDLSAYQLFQGSPTRLLADGDSIDLGDRTIRVFHTPGHSPGHMCFWEEARGWLFTGDLVYLGTLLAYYPSTDPEAYLASLEKISTLPVQRIFPGHHSLDVSPKLLSQMRNTLRELKARGELCFGSGIHDYGDWAIRL